MALNSLISEADKSTRAHAPRRTGSGWPIVPSVPQEQSRVFTACKLHAEYGYGVFMRMNFVLVCK